MVAAPATNNQRPLRPLRAFFGCSSRLPCSFGFGAMASSSGQRVLYCGFKGISNIDTFFKKKSVKRGRKLFAANHVYGVREELASAVGPSDVLGKCVAQMKGVDYDVRLEVSNINGNEFGSKHSNALLHFIKISANPRQIVGASCSCKAGCRGWCKHAAAVAIYINEHDVVSCTDVPCEWRKPSSRPTLDTKKSVEELFPSKAVYQHSYVCIVG